MLIGVCASTVDVLIAESSLAIARRLIEHIQECGPVSILGPARDATSALLCCEKTVPDLAIIDIQVFAAPVGPKLVQTLVESRCERLVMVSLRGMEVSLREACLGAGADHFFDLSTDVDRICAVVQELVRRRT